ncbi:MAG: inositol monophosphatase family protein [Balneolales bacterium]
MIQSIKSRLEILKKYLHKSGEYIRNQRPGIAEKTREKEDGSPVTSADEWGNEYWQAIIEKEFPGEIFIGEESASHAYPEQAEFIWYVDPIDGTKEYISGYGNYYTLIGLAVKGKPALGLVHEPETGKIIYAGQEQGPVMVNGSPRGPFPLDGIRSWKDSNRLMMRGIDAGKRNRLREQFKIERLKHVGVTHNQLGPLFNKSSGFASNRTTSYWDLCAPAAIMSAAGFAVDLVNNGKSVPLNDGSSRADRFYILPGDTPEEVKRALMNW